MVCMICDVQLYVEMVNFKSTTRWSWNTITYWEWNTGAKADKANDRGQTPRSLMLDEGRDSMYMNMLNKLDKDGAMAFEDAPGTPW